jgi:hypothetical protein
MELKIIVKKTSNINKKILKLRFIFMQKCRAKINIHLIANKLYNRITSLATSKLKILNLKNNLNKKTSKKKVWNLLRNINFNQK